MDRSSPAAPRHLTRLLAATALLSLSACVAPHRLDDGPLRRPVADLPPLPPLPPSQPAQPSPTKAAPSPAAIRPVATTTAALPVDVNASFRLQAQQELQQSYQFTGLNDAQVALQKSAEAAIVRGDYRSGYQTLHQLNTQLKNGVKPYAVKSGDSLWIISGKPEVYGNPWLWPLIWQANIRIVPDPNRLQAGEQLKIRPHPTIQEVVDAVDSAREGAHGSQTRIGEVREVPPAR